MARRGAAARRRAGWVRYARVAALAVSITTVAVALLGGAGLIGGAGSADPAVAAPPRSTTPAGDAASEQAAVAGPELPAHPQRMLPPYSGTGKRVVFSQSRQRVWLVAGDDDQNQANDRVLRTYLVSGSLYDNLDTGTYEVYSRSEHAWGINDSGTMDLFVRFARGDTGAAIGFHDIPVDDGAKVQSLAQLGTPQSHGCIRQAHADAKALWDFAPVGTTVVVTR